MTAVTQDLISYYKNLHDGHKIIYVRFSDMEFLFRTLSKAEYKNILFIYGNNNYDIKDAVCNTACLYPEEYDFFTCGYAGISDFVADHIEQLSGFRDVDVIINDYKIAKQQVNLELQAMDMIKAFIPEYTYEEMKDWSWQKLMEMAVRAEEVAKLHHFDWHLEENEEEREEAHEKTSSNNREFIDELYKSGIDPMIYFRDEIEMELRTKKNVLDFPLISSNRWNDEGIINVIREQRKLSNFR